jgi:hypothetical protein
MTRAPGQRIGRLTLLQRMKGARWLCRCDCGKEKAVNVYCSPPIMSCGCLRREQVSRVRAGAMPAITPADRDEFLDGHGF